MTKKKRSKKRSAPKRRKQAAPGPTDRRAFEKQLSDISKMLAEREFESVEEMNDFLQKFLASGDPLPAPQPDTPLQKAQEVMYQAFDAYGRKRIKLARKALKISQDCTDAYVLLAEEAARSPQEALDLYEKGVNAAERVLGPEAFTEYVGHFWGIMETRPYMRARAGLAGVLWAMGSHDEAIDHLQELLRLNPGDNQGLRYFLATALLRAGRHDELAKLLKRYDEVSAYWAYTAALLAYKQRGATSASDRDLDRAVEANPYVPDYLLGHKSLPQQSPEYVGLGDENEALDYVAGNVHLWAETPGALTWLARHVGDGGFDEEWLSDDVDDWYVDAEDTDFPFEFDTWVKELEFPRKEHAALRRAIRRGVSAFSGDYYGHDRYKRETQDIIDEQLEVPLVYGYAATEILKDDRISLDTKQKVIEFAIVTVQPAEYLGIPHGLLEMLGFLARHGRLLPTHLIFGVLALEANSLFKFGPSPWIDGVTSPAMAELADWIASCDELEEDEKLWLAWKLTVNCESASHLGKAFATSWFDHPRISDETKRRLCWSWLESNREVGSPHPVWRLLYAYMRGDSEEIKRLREEHDIDPAIFPLPDPQELPRDMPDSFRDPVRQHRLTLMSPYLKRVAIPRLVRLGQDPHDLIERFWDHDDDYVLTYLRLGIGDALVEFHDRFDSDELRRLIERGVRDSSAQVRKPFYLFSTNFYGDHYLREALDDNAASIRRWAVNKLNRRS